MKILNAALLSLCALILPLAATRAASIDLHPIDDTSLLESNPDSNLGAVSPILAGTTANGPRSRALFKLDLAQITPGSTISSASFRLQVTKKNLVGVGSNFTLHRLLSDWGKGTGNFLAGIPAKDGEATWNNRFHPSTPWSTPGGEAGVDYVTAGSGTLFIDEVGAYTFTSNPTMVADIQAWVANPATNFGWILITESEGQVLTARRIASTEDANLPPTLTVQYTPGNQPPPATPPTIASLALAGNQIHFSFPAESNRTYAVEFRAVIDNTNWATLTNIPALPAAATIDVSDITTGTNRFYRVRTP